MWYRNSDYELDTEMWTNIKSIALNATVSDDKPVLLKIAWDTISDLPIQIRIQGFRAYKGRLTPEVWTQKRQLLKVVGS